jgi:hypothetical protein
MGCWSGSYDCFFSVLWFSWRFTGRCVVVVTLSDQIMDVIGSPCKFRYLGTLSVVNLLGPRKLQSNCKFDPVL